MRRLSEPIGVAAGVLWLVAAGVVVAAGVALLIGVRWWWIAAAAAAVASQGAILTAWGDARAGTVANILLLGAAVYGYASQGPTSQRAEYRRRVDAALSASPGEDVVTDADLAHLPAPVAAYVRRCGAVGQPRVVNFHARIHGRIRGGADKGWMPFTGEQVDTFGPVPTRQFFMDATMFGLPVDVLHVHDGRSATMRVRLCSLLPMVHASGPDVDRAETVTLVNDLCVLAPAALVDAPIMWHAIDDRRVRGSFTSRQHTVSAVLVFDRDGDLLDFVSDDRLRSSPDGTRFTRQRWSAPVGGYDTFGTRRLSSAGEARWHSPGPEGEFAYLQVHVDAVAYNIGHTATDTVHTPLAPPRRRTTVGASTSGGGPR